jgi:hypothetical protein
LRLRGNTPGLNKVNSQSRLTVIVVF